MEEGLLTPHALSTGDFVVSAVITVVLMLFSAFFSGVAGGLFAHLLQFISPRVFDIIKSTDVLIMVYLGGIALFAASVFTLRYGIRTLRKN